MRQSRWLARREDCRERARIGLQGAALDQEAGNGLGRNGKGGEREAANGRGAYTERERGEWASREWVCGRQEPADREMSGRGARSCLAVLIGFFPQQIATLCKTFSGVVMDT